MFGVLSMQGDLNPVVGSLGLFRYRDTIQHTYSLIGFITLA